MFLKKHIWFKFCTRMCIKHVYCTQGLHNFIFTISLWLLFTISISLSIHCLTFTFSSHFHFPFTLSLSLECKTFTSSSHFHVQFTVSLSVHRFTFTFYWLLLHQFTHSSSQELLGQILEISVWDKDQRSKDDFMGRFTWIWRQFLLNVSSECFQQILSFHICMFEGAPWTYMRWSER